MITVKIQCGCGQKFAFDVEPIHGRMPTRVACPSCSADGTAAANEFIEQVWVEPVAEIASVAPMPVAAPPPLVASQATGLRIAGAPAPVSAPPPITSAPPPIVHRPPAKPAPGQRFAPKPVAQQKGKDGWDCPEETINKIGTWTIGLAAINAALLKWGMFGEVSVDLLVLCIVVGLCGAIGGALNVLNRGPIWAGAIAGTVMGLGGFLAAYFWMQGARKVWVFEVIIASVVGYLPGFGLQWLFQKLTGRR